MSNENDPDGADDEPSAWEPVDDNDDGELEERSRRLDEKEERLDQKERELNKRERDLEKREQEILERREENVDVREELEAKEEELEEKETALDDRETALEERERELSRRADQIETKEQALDDHVGDQLADLESSIGDTIEDRVSAAVKKHAGGSTSRIGTVGGVLLGLVGIVLVVGGVSNIFAVELVGRAGSSPIPTLFAAESVTTNYVVSAFLVLVGLAASLAAAAGRP